MNILLNALRGALENYPTPQRKRDLGSLIGVGCGHLDTAAYSGVQALILATADHTVQHIVNAISYAATAIVCRVCWNAF